MTTIDYSKLTVEVANKAVQTRGGVLDFFCFIEQELMDVIILYWGLESDNGREQFIAKNFRWKIPMERKQELLKKGITRYQEEYKEELSGMYNSFDSLIESRNILAHWMTDVSYPGIENYYKTNSIRFVSSNMKYTFDFTEKHFYKEFLFDSNKLQELKKEMDNLSNHRVKVVEKIISPVQAITP